MIGCDAKKREYELKKINRYRFNNIRYPIPGSKYEKQYNDDRGLFTVEKDEKKLKEQSMTEAVAEKRKELVKQIIKGNYNLQEATIHPLAVLTPNDFKIIEKARNEKNSIELKKQ